MSRSRGRPGSCAGHRRSTQRACRPRPAVDAQATSSCMNTTLPGPCLVTDHVVAETAARHSQIPRQLDEISRDTMRAAHSAPRPEYRSSAQPPEEILWNALNAGPRKEARAAPIRSAGAGGAPAPLKEITVSDRPFVPPSRASARNGRDGTTGRDDGTNARPTGSHRSTRYAHRGGLTRARKPTRR